MTAIPFSDWLNKQGNNIQLDMCEGHPETLILVDMTNMHVYKYVPAENQNDTRDIMREFLSKIGPSNEVRDFVQYEMHDAKLNLKETRMSELKAENAKLKELVNGLTWCCEHSECDNRCPLYAGHCREEWLKHKLKMT